MSREPPPEPTKEEVAKLAELFGWNDDDWVCPAYVVVEDIRRCGDLLRKSLIETGVHRAGEWIDWGDAPRQYMARGLPRTAVRLSRWGLKALGEAVDD